MSNQFWGHRVNLLLKSLVKSFVLCIALRVIKFFAVCQQFPFLYVNCFNRPAKGSPGTFLDLLQNISFLFLHEWILILVKWDEKIAFLCWTKFPGSYLSLSCLYPLWALLPLSPFEYCRRRVHGLPVFNQKKKFLQKPGKTLKLKTGLFKWMLFGVS